MRIANRDARRYVKALEEFQGSNLFAQRYSGNDRGAVARYVVYSYGYHWPLFIYVPLTGVWFENGDRYSQTTSKHRGQTHPHVDTVVLPAHAMRHLAAYGEIPVDDAGEQAVNKVIKLARALPGWRKNNA